MSHINLRRFVGAYESNFQRFEKLLKKEIDKLNENDFKRDKGVQVAPGIYRRRLSF